MNTSDNNVNNNQANNNSRVANTNNVVQSNNNVSNSNGDKKVESAPVIKVSTDKPSNSNVVGQNNVVNNNVNITNNNNPINNSPQKVEAPVNVTKVVKPTTNNVVDSANNSANAENKKGGNFKTFLLILFFIALFLFIMFLPDISNYFRNRGINSDDNEVKNGNLICKMERNSDLTDISYEYNFGFTSKQLMSSSINTTISSEAKDVIIDEYNKCQEISKIGEEVDGIEVTCTTSDNITTIIQSNDYKMIDNDNLTKFTEAGGIYPEFMYKDNIYTIQNKMIRSGYDCEIKAR